MSDVDIAEPPGVRTGDQSDKTSAGVNIRRGPTTREKFSDGGGNESDDKRSDTDAPRQSKIYSISSYLTLFAIVATW